jgi:hypothetical protein
MTSRRATAYRRVVKTLRDFGAAKLWPAEQARIREAADALLFCWPSAPSMLASGSSRSSTQIGRRTVWASNSADERVIAGRVQTGSGD